MGFYDASSKLPNLLSDLLAQPKHPFRTLTQGTISSVMGNTAPIPGVFLMRENDQPVYIGRSGHLAQRVGTDLRANNKEQANLTHRLLTSGNISGVTDMLSARDYMYRTYTVQLLAVDDVIERALLQIYAAVELGTKYNSLLET